ncbi:histidine kinase [Paenibacillus lignilyticus]|uniref:Histidine kinase n=1 Tax=Paenibacillus lignilyticus TaxID=1172615 RepID=A0ABS5CI03_9BACL|nr:histidine kinase [Paenibacillus lignilyticus]MBP3965439.1 histidine kinase [Paenibacillus lignilyticus]
MAGYRRKTPEEMLLSISKIHRGRLKIYVGAVSGSGKTYHMLREGQALKQQGIEVVICAVSTMRRPETVEQLADLERIPSIHWHKGDVEKKDLNLDAILERNPEVLLVDGLAHENRPEAKFPTRLEDIQFLLSHGISIITTVNVYELEGVTELAQKLTGITAECTVSADLLELADEVRLIDASPETILSRLNEGRLNNIKDPGLLKRGNLGKLRELALRLMAEGVNESLEKYREEQGFIGPSGATERILVAAQYHWNGSIYIRRGQQIAKRLGGDLEVVVFVDSSQEPTKEREDFKRSILKLTEKVDAGFREILVNNRRQIPRALIKYAMLINATRIVMGHSKQTRAQEIAQGSIAGSVLKQMRNIDVFFMADRAEHEGERVLPTKRATPKMTAEPYRRLSAQEVEKKIERIRRGKFKVYVGAAPGAGKSYMMLREGNDLLRKEIDVVVGLMETHDRAETQDQAGRLEVVPRLTIDGDGRVYSEMDVDAIIARNPEVVLIDELAHTNAPSCRNKRRYEDVQEILNAGISVIATMNVHHLESLKDAVEQITGTAVKETVPDMMLRLADEVELIDVAPDTLQQRMREGHIYKMCDVEDALCGFFKTGNLIALRELALREIADDVDERLESWERNGSLRGPWRRHESIFVAVTVNKKAERLIRRGFRIAHRLKADWHVHYVQTDAVPGEEERIEELQELTARLGGTFEAERNVSRNDVPAALLAKANVLKSTQMVLGQSGQGFWSKLRNKCVVDTILREGRHMDVLVVADFNPNIEIGEE